MSHPGYLADCLVDIHAVFYLKLFFFFRIHSEHGGRDKPTK